jgi:hypothetical protein
MEISVDKDLALIRELCGQISRETDPQRLCESLFALKGLLAVQLAAASLRVQAFVKEHPEMLRQPD